MTKLYRGGSLIFDSEAVTGELPAPSITMTADGSPVSGTVAAGAALGAELAGDVSAFIHALGPLTLVVGGTDADTVTFAGLAAGSTVAAPTSGTLQWRWGTGPDAITSQSVTVEAPAYTTSITRLDSGSLSKTLTGFAPNRVMVGGGFRIPSDGTLGNTHHLDGPMSFYIENSGSLAFIVDYTDALGAAQVILQTTAQSGGSGETFALGDKIAWRAEISVGGEQLVYYSRNAGPWTLLKTPAPVPADWTIAVNGTWHIARSQFFRSVEVSGFDLYFPTGDPDLGNSRDKFVGPDGWSADPAITRAHIGVDPVLEQYGDAAAYTARTNTGTGGAWDSLTATVSDVALSTEPLVPANAELLSRLSIQPHRTGDIIEGQPIDYRIEGLTEEEYKTWAFYWNMDDEGEAGFNPVQSNLPGIYSNPIMRTFPVGPTTTYAHRTPRARTLKVNVVPPVWSGIEGCQLTYAVDIKPLSHLYDSTNTWVVVPAGVADPTEIAGTRVATLGEAWNAGEATATGDALIYLPGGETITPAAGSIGGRYDRDNARLYLMSYGTGKCMIDCTQESLEASHLACPLTWTIRNVAFDGGWDPVTADGAGRTPISHGRARTHLGLTDCLVQNSNYGVKLDYNPSDETLMAFDRYSLMAFDTHFDNCLDYGVFVAKCHHIGLAGCTALWKKDMPRTKDGKAILGVNDYAIHGLGRFSFVKYATFYNVSGSIDHGWSDATFADPAVESLNSNYGAVQALLRVGSSELIDGSRIHIGRSYCEGQLVALDAGAGGGIEYPSCIAASGIYVLGSAATNNIMQFGHSGVNWANNFIIAPVAPGEVTNDYRPYSLGNMDESEAAPGLRDKAFAFSRSAVLYMRTQIDGSVTSLDSLTGADLSDPALLTQIPVRVDGVIAYAPNLSITGTDTGITTTPWGPQPRKIGLFLEKADETIFSDLQYATPANSAIIGHRTAALPVAPTVDTPADDFWGKLRPATPTAGPIEASPLTGVFGPWVEPDTSPSNEAVV